LFVVMNPHECSVAKGMRGLMLVWNLMCENWNFNCLSGNKSSSFHILSYDFAYLHPKWVQHRAILCFLFQFQYPLVSLSSSCLCLLLCLAINSFLNNLS
jgi:hypothetical protein